MTDETPATIPGAEPWSHEGGPVGVLVLHGFTGNPSSMRPVAEAVAAAGHGVELPRLPGHGTTVEDLAGTTWADWLAEAEAAYQRLASRSEQVVVVGLSMGGALTAWLGAEHPEVAGLVCINPIVSTPEGMREAVEQVLESGADRMAAIGSDIAKPGVVESSYEETPLRPLLSLFDAASELDGRLSSITSPLLVITSPQDHVVPPENSDVLAQRAAGPVERMTCDRSYHVATLDYDGEAIVAAVLDFVQKVTAAG